MAKSNTPVDLNKSVKFPPNGSWFWTCKVIPFFIEPNVVELGISETVSIRSGNEMFIIASSDKSLPEKLPIVILVRV